MDKCSSPALRTVRRISEPSARICATPQGKSYRSVEDEGILEWLVERADSRETISIVLLRLTTGRCCVSINLPLRGFVKKDDLLET